MLARRTYLVSFASSLGKSYLSCCFHPGLSISTVRQLAVLSDVAVPHLTPRGEIGEVQLGSLTTDWTELLEPQLHPALGRLDQPAKHSGRFGRPSRRRRPLAQLTNLERLELSRTEVAEPARSQPHQPADLSTSRDTQVADARPTRRPHQPANARPLDTQVADAAPLASLTNLQTLYLARHAGRRLSPRSPTSPICKRSPSPTRRSPTPPRSPASPTCKRSTSTAPRSPTPPARQPHQPAIRSTSPAPRSPTPPRSQASPTCKRSTSPAPRSPTPPRSQASPTCEWLDLSGTQVSQEQVTELKRALAERGNRSDQIYRPVSGDRAPNPRADAPGHRLERREVAAGDRTVSGVHAGAG